MGFKARKTTKTVAPTTYTVTTSGGTKTFDSLVVATQTIAMAMTKANKDVTVTIK